MHQTMRKTQLVSVRLIGSVVLFVLAVVLTSCGTMKAEITFLQDEKWHYDAKLAVDAEWFTDEGGPELVEEYMADIESQIRNEAPDVIIDLDRGSIEGEYVVYNLSIKGEGWEKLESVADFTITPEGEKIHVQYPLQSMSDFEITSITFKGNEIISSNADETTAGSATWQNPYGTIEAVLIPKRGVTWRPLIFSLAILILGVLMYRSLRRS